MNQNKAIQLLRAILISAMAYFMAVNTASAFPGYGNGAACGTCHVSTCATGGSCARLDCPAGQSRDPVTHLCTAPPPVACTGNTFGPNGMSPCTPCPAGQTANATHTACVMPAPNCMGNTVLLPGQTSCTTCILPQAPNATHTACISCSTQVPPQVPTGDGSACMSCPAGQIPNAAGTACVNMPPPTCIPPQVLNPAGTACVNPPQTMHDDEHEMEHEMEHGRRNDYRMRDDHRNRGSRDGHSGRDD